MAKKTVWKLVAVAAILMIAVAAWDWCLAKMASEPRNVTIRQLRGNALVERLDSQISMYEGMRLKTNDKIYVTKGKGLTIDFDEKHFLFAEPESEFVITLTEDKNDDSTRVQMEQGSVLFSVQREVKNEVQFCVETPTIQLNVQETRNAEETLFHVSCTQEAQEKAVRVSVLEGCIEVTDESEQTAKKIFGGKTLSRTVEDDGTVVWQEEDIALPAFSPEMLEQLGSIAEEGRTLCFSKTELEEEQESRAAMQTSSIRVEGTQTAEEEPEQVSATPPVVSQPPASATPAIPQKPTEVPVIASSTTVPTKNPAEVSLTPTSPELTSTPIESTPIPPEPTATPASEPTAIPAEPTKAPESGESSMGGVLSALLGQTPIVNAEDDIYTYYEFAEGILTAAEPRMEREGKKLEEVLTKFIFQLVLSGVDINTIEINAPITREEAALVIYYAAQAIAYSSAGTAITEVTTYVTDVSECTVAEKKAIGYLYQEGYLAGYQIAGQQFLPEQSLSAAVGENWIALSKNRWTE